MRFRHTLVHAAFWLAGAASAATFTVTDRASLAADALPGDGVCATAGGTCSFAAALGEANALPGRDIVVIEPGVGGALPDAGLIVDDDLAITGSGTLAGASATSVLRVAPGTRLDMDGVTVCAPIEIDGELHGNMLDLGCADPMLVRAGGRAELTGGVAGLSRVEGGDLILDGVIMTGPSPSGPSPPPLLSVLGGSATLARARIPAETRIVFGQPWTAIEVSGGSLLVSDSDLELLTGVLLLASGGSARLERSRLAAIEPAQPGERWMLDDLVIAGGGSSVILDRCELSGVQGHAVRVADTGTAVIDSCDISGTRGHGITSGGELLVRGTTIRGTRPWFSGLSGDRGRAGSGIEIHGGVARMERCLVTDNVTDKYQGRFPVFEPQVVNGGGVRVVGGRLTISDGVISNNQALSTSGATGGGIAVLGGDLVVERSLIVGNRVPGDGAGIAVHGGSALIAGSTITLGVASHAIFRGDVDPVDDRDVPGRGGAVAVLGGSVQLRGCSIAGNSTADDAAVTVLAPGTLVASDSILADNGLDCSGSVDSAGFLLIEDASTCTVGGDLTGVATGVDSLLLPLADNGGPTQSMLLDVGSPARDAANPAGLADGMGGTLLVDQRGAFRVTDGDGDGLARGDLGATEACFDPTDSDGDLAGDACDPCPLVAGPHADADHDGMGDECDSGDADGDGVADMDDVCPDRPDASQADSDGDGRGDACDGCPTIADDGSDGDGDGAGDACDTCLDDRNVLQRPDEPDGDRLCGVLDNCPLIANADQLDADADGVGDACDNAPLDANPDQADADGDGVGDVADPCPRDAFDDADLDGVCADLDNCPADGNADQANADGDANGDACDGCPLDPQDDIDADAHCGDADNCPEQANGGQEDADGDGVGDACDLDCAEPADLRVAGDDAGLVLEWAVPPGQLADVHLGDLATLRGGYEMPATACAVDSGAIVLAPFSATYILVGGRCGTARTVLGRDSFGVAIAPTAACP